MLDPSPHPDLVWLAPSGAQHMVEEVRERVIRASAYRPFEGGSRVFVVESAEAMRDESQNALLKTLEEPPEFVHLILLSAEPAALLETVTSRCQPVEFAPLPVEAVEAELSGVGDPDEVAAAARLAAGDLDRARALLADAGRELRAEAERCAEAAIEGESASAPWKRLLKTAEEAGAGVEDATRAALEEEKAAGVKRSAREIADEAKRAGRRRRTEVLDLGLALLAAWFRDLAATAAGAERARIQPRPPRPARGAGRGAGASRGRVRPPRSSRTPAGASTSTSPRSLRWRPFCTARADPPFSASRLLAGLLDRPLLGEAGDLGRLPGHDHAEVEGEGEQQEEDDREQGDVGVADAHHVGGEASAGRGRRRRAASPARPRTRRCCSAPAAGRA